MRRYGGKHDRCFSQTFSALANWIGKRDVYFIWCMLSSTCRIVCSHRLAVLISFPSKRNFIWASTSTWFSVTITSMKRRGASDEEKENENKKTEGEPNGGKGRGKEEKAMCKLRRIYCIRERKKSQKKKVL